MHPACPTQTSSAKATQWSKMRGHGVTRETLDWLKTREKGTQQIGIVLAGKVRRELTLPSLGSAHKTHLEKKWGRGKRETGRKGSVIWATLEMKS